MTNDHLIGELKTSEEFFERSSRCLSEEDSSFHPNPDMYTVAQQVSHVARTIDWMVDGASRPDGFDMDFEHHVAEAMAVTSLTEARAWLARAFAGARTFFGSMTETELSRPLPPGPVMGGLPVWYVVFAISEHNAHHRGALTVYSRAVGKVPLMPYFEM